MLKILYNTYSDKNTIINRTSMQSTIEVITYLHNIASMKPRNKEITSITLLYLASFDLVPHNEHFICHGLNDIKKSINDISFKQSGHFIVMTSISLFFIMNDSIILYPPNIKNTIELIYF